METEKRLKLIDYDEARTLFDEQYKKTAQLIRNGETHLDNLAEGFAEADQVIRKLPTVDAVEVVHGRWRKRGNETMCSVCKFIYYSNRDEFNYCPNCGAKMDGERRKGE